MRFGRLLILSWQFRGQIIVKFKPQRNQQTESMLCVIAWFKWSIRWGCYVFKKRGLVKLVKFAHTRTNKTWQEKLVRHVCEPVNWSRKLVKGNLPVCTGLYRVTWGSGSRVCYKKKISYKHNSLFFSGYLIPRETICWSYWLIRDRLIRCFSLYFGFN